MSVLLQSVYYEFCNLTISATCKKKFINVRIKSLSQAICTTSKQTDVTSIISPNFTRIIQIRLKVVLERLWSENFSQQLALSGSVHAWEQQTQQLGDGASAAQVRGQKLSFWSITVDRVANAQYSKCPLRQSSNHRRILCNWRPITCRLTDSSWRKFTTRRVSVRPSCAYRLSILSLNERDDLLGLGTSHQRAQQLNDGHFQIWFFR
jgi:hypothetical protein